MMLKIERRMVAKLMYFKIKPVRCPTRSLLLANVLTNAFKKARIINRLTITIAVSTKWFKFLS